jgi:hypothetical protein
VRSLDYHLDLPVRTALRHEISCWASALCLTLMGCGWLLTATALASSEPGSPCSSTVVSAQNQYCEDIPGADGPRWTGSRTRTLATTLPHAVLGRIGSSAGSAGVPSAGRATPSGQTNRVAQPQQSQSQQSRHPQSRRPRGTAPVAATALLSLPAPARHEPLPADSSGSTSPVSQFGWLIAVLVAIPVGAGAAAVARRRRTAT